MSYMPDHRPYEYSEEDDIPWDFDCFGDLGNYDEAGNSWTGFESD